MTQFTNSHIHIFNSDCAPEYFLRILNIKLVRRFPGTIKKLLENKISRKVIWRLNKLIARNPKKRRSTLKKYISFLNVGTQRSQQEVFEIALKVANTYDSQARVVALTMDMDFMDNQGDLPLKPFYTQLEEVKALKRYYKKNLYPFLGVDPRNKSGQVLVEWAKTHLERGVLDKRTGSVHPYFYGIKLYPALGFFPFDPRLDKLYEYAEENGIPIMSHCTRSGSYYVGNVITSLIPKDPPMIIANTPEFPAIRKKIYDRIRRYYEFELIKDRKDGNNDIACDLFGHPENYVPIMMKYPGLKICLAHLGGSDEIHRMGEDFVEDWQKADGSNWSQLIIDLMQQYDHLYTDISYTLSDLVNSVINNFINNKLLTPIVSGQALGNRVLFGTDFYMTEQEASENKLYQLAKNHIDPQWYTKITVDNPHRYLF